LSDSHLLIKFRYCWIRPFCSRQEKSNLTDLHKGGVAGQVIISQADGTGSGATWLGTDPANGKLITNLTFFELPSESVITDGQWHHVGIVWNGSRRYLYVDGAEVTKDTSDQFAILCDVDLYFGAGKDLAAASFFSGLIDDVRIYSRALSADAVAALAD